MKIDATTKAMMFAAAKRDDHRILILTTKDIGRCNELKKVGLAEFRGDAWFLTEKARKMLGAPR